MKNTSTDTLRILTAKLSDGELSAAEAEQLSELLSQDPIAQEQFLDHLTMDALLEREFSGAVSSSLVIPRSANVLESKESFRSLGLRTRYSSWQSWILVPLFLFIVSIGTGGWYWFSSTAAVASQTLLLADAGFENDALHVKGNPSATSWYGDAAEVVGEHSQIMPLEGSRMVRFVKSKFKPKHGCELYQLVDLKELIGTTPAGDHKIEASAFFNATPWANDNKDYLFEISLFAYAKPPEELQDAPLQSDRPLHYSGSKTLADQDAASWQQVTTDLELPAGTQYVMIQLSVSGTNPDSKEEFPGHYADNVQLKLAATE